MIWNPSLTSFVLPEGWTIEPVEKDQMVISSPTMLIRLSPQGGLSDRR